MKTTQLSSGDKVKVINMPVGPVIEWHGIIEFDFIYDRVKWYSVRCMDGFGPSVGCLASNLIKEVTK